jgi:peptidoglycan/xylan/chitin deacetylase (PgdA/CDA1 family)/glycosyltransferase involved in cell wall biosynthesis
VRILFISTIFPNPGLPHLGVFNLRLLRALVPEHDVRVIAPVPWTQGWFGTAKDSVESGTNSSRILEGVEVHHPRYFYIPKLLRQYYAVFYWWSIRRKVRELLKSFRPDVVLAYWAHPDGDVANRIGERLGIASAVIVGGSDIQVITREPGRRRRVQKVLQEVDAVITVSKDLKANAIQLGASVEKVRVMYQGIDPTIYFPGEQHEARRRLGIPTEGKILLWVGRMVSVKGLDVLVQSCSILKQSGVGFHLYLVGDGPLRSRLDYLIRDQGLSQDVTFAGSLPYDQLPDWYRAANLTVLPSRSEGLPNVLRESLACGTPFVASRVGSIVEIAPDGWSRLVPPDDPGALADAIAAALNRSTTNLPSFRARTWEESAESLVQILQPFVPPAPEQNGPRPTRRWPGLVVANNRPSALNWRQILRRVMAVTLPRRMLLVNGPVKSGSICLTFDDGPDPVHTPRLLDVLKEQQISATFFVIGRQAERYPELVRRMVAEGHAVGNHSFTHSEPIRLSAQQLMEEVRQTRDLLFALTGQAPALFRPPKGMVTASKLLALWRSGQTVVLWNSDPKDYVSQSTEEIHAWFQKNPLRAGDLVLMHDNRPFAAEVLPELITSARRRGQKFVRVSQWVQ